MEYVKKLLTKVGWSSILESLVFFILGIILVLKPEGTIRAISLILGSLFLMIGILKIANYFITKGQNQIYNYDFVYGLTAIVIGILVMVYIDTIGSIFRIIIGVWILYTSFVRMNLSFKMKAFNCKIWFYSFLLSVLMFSCGLYTVINSGTVIVTIGIIMIFYAVIDIIENIIFMKNVKNYLK